MIALGGWVVLAGGLLLAALFFRAVPLIHKGAVGLVLMLPSLALLLAICRNKR